MSRTRLTRSFAASSLPRSSVLSFSLSQLTSAGCKLSASFHPFFATPLRHMHVFCLGFYSRPDSCCSCRNRQNTLYIRADAVEATKHQQQRRRTLTAAARKLSLCTWARIYASCRSLLGEFFFARERETLFSLHCNCSRACGRALFWRRARDGTCFASLSRFAFVCARKQLFGFRFWKIFQLQCINQMIFSYILWRKKKSFARIKPRISNTARTSSSFAMFCFLSILIHTAPVYL